MLATRITEPNSVSSSVEDIPRAAKRQREDYDLRGLHNTVVGLRQDLNSLMAKVGSMEVKQDQHDLVVGEGMTNLQNELKEIRRVLWKQSDTLVRVYDRLRSLESEAMEVRAT